VARNGLMTRRRIQDRSLPELRSSRSRRVRGGTMSSSPGRKSGSSSPVYCPDPLAAGCHGPECTVFHLSSQKYKSEKKSNNLG